MILINEMNGQINKFCSAGLNVFELFAGFCNNIYFFSGWYGCSNVAAADAVADEAAVVAGPAFVACYHCHLPRSLYKHGASLEAPYPLHISQFLFQTVEKLSMLSGSQFLSSRNSLNFPSNATNWYR